MSALVTLASPLYPNVPDLPGVPPVARQVGSTLLAASPLVSSAVANLITGGPQVEKWGILDASYNFAVVADSFVKVDFDRSMKISDYPVEKGQFSSYNKVHVPYSGTVSLAQGGTNGDRATFFAATNAVEESLQPFYVMTPEGSFGPVSIDRVSYERTATNGARLIIAHLHFTQIRVAPPIGTTSASGVPVASKVPQKAVTNPTTSLGLIDPTKVSSVTAYAVSHGGAVIPKPVPQVSAPAPSGGYTLSYSQLFTAY